jgi:hypothetical protein
MTGKVSVCSTVFKGLGNGRDKGKKKMTCVCVHGRKGGIRRHDSQTSLHNVIPPPQNVPKRQGRSMAMRAGEGDGMQGSF